MTILVLGYANLEPLFCFTQYNERACLNMMIPRVGIFVSSYRILSPSLSRACTCSHTHPMTCAFLYQESERPDYIPQNFSSEHFSRMWYYRCKGSPTSLKPHLGGCSSSCFLCGLLYQLPLRRFQCAVIIQSSQFVLKALYFENLEAHRVDCQLLPRSVDRRGRWVTLVKQYFFKEK